MSTTKKTEPAPAGLRERLDYNADFRLDWHDPDEATDGYQLKWIGKDYARLQTGTAPSTVVTPDAEWNGRHENAASENLFFTGDNLEALKHLQNAYRGAVDMIYIDPPYNTGKEFVYSDSFEWIVGRGSGQLKVDSGQGGSGQLKVGSGQGGVGSGQEDRYARMKAALGYTDKECARIEALQGRSSHSAWLTFMYPRLRLARTLLKDSGVIFISIDDNEQANLRLLCDEVFGEGNFILCIAWRRTDNQPNIGDVARVKEYILCYARNINSVNLGKLPLSEKALNEYRYEDDKGKFRRAILLDKTRGWHRYDVKTKSGHILSGPWMITETEFIKRDKAGEIYWTSGGDEQPYGKIYLHKSGGQIPSDFWGIEFGTNQRASLEVEALFEKRIFDFPKPVSLITKLLQLACPLPTTHYPLPQSVQSSDNPSSLPSDPSLIIAKLDEYAVPMEVRELSREEFDALFPDSKVDTPLGVVKIGENQFNKLWNRDAGGRRGLLGAMYQTLHDPVVVIPEGNVLLFIKSFSAEKTNGYKTVMSVIVEKNGEKVSISTYQRKNREIIEKIKRAGSFAYVIGNDPQPHEQTASEDTRQNIIYHTPQNLSSGKVGVRDQGLGGSGQIQGHSPLIPDPRPLILDFFAGSGTTAHAVMKLNAEDGGARRWILVQLDEPTAEGSEARKAGFTTIDEIARERIKKAADRISGQWTVNSEQQRDLKVERTTGKSVGSPQDFRAKTLSTTHYALSTSSPTIHSLNKEVLSHYGCTKLSRADCLAKSNESSNADLQTGETIAEGGDLFTQRSNAESGSVDSEQHSGRTGAEKHKRISAFPVDSTRIAGRTGNSTALDNTNWIPCRYGHFGNDEPSARNQSDVECPHWQTKNCPLTSQHYPLPTAHYPLDLGFRHFRVHELDTPTIDTITEFDPSKPMQKDMFENMAGKIGVPTILATWLCADGYGLRPGIVTPVEFAGGRGYHVDTLLYLIDEGWGADQTKALLNAIGTGKINVNTIIIFGYSFTMESLRELEINVTQSLNRSVTVEKRY